MICDVVTDPREFRRRQELLLKLWGEMHRKNRTRFVLGIYGGLKLSDPGPEKLNKFVEGGFAELPRGFQDYARLYLVPGVSPPVPPPTRSVVALGLSAA